MPLLPINLLEHGPAVEIQYPGMVEYGYFALGAVIIATLFKLEAYIAKSNDIKKR